MKFYAVLAASAIAVASAADCDVTKLLPLVSGPNGAACNTATGYTPVSLTIPTGDELKKVCSTASCNALLKDFATAVPEECTFQGVPIKSTLIDKFPPACEKALGGAAGANATTAAPGANATTAAPGANATTPKPEATTVKPEATTVKPANSKGAGSAGSAGSPKDDVTKAPTSKPTTVPTPAPTKSGASTVVAAASAIVVAVAASLF